MKKHHLVCGIGACVALAFSAAAQNFQADFNAGNDTGWSRYAPLSGFGVTPTFSFPSGAYRIETPGSPLPGVIGPGRAGSFRSDLNVSDFSIGYDLAAWGTTPEFAGAFARVSNVGLGTLNGYALGFDFSVKRLFISVVAGENVTKVISASEAAVTLDPLKTYRLQFSGTGASFTGNLIDPSNGTVLSSISGSDSTYASGIVGLGVAAQTPTAGVGAGATFDNVSVTPEPGTWALLGTGIAVIGCLSRKRC
jgi:hypothetical protein